MTENEFIKAKLDLIKLYISAVLAAVFLIAVYNLQTGGVHIVNTMIGVIVLLVGLLILTYGYCLIAKNYLNE